VIRRTPPSYYSGYDAETHWKADVHLQDAAPFHYKHGNAEAVVVCLHGFTATPFEVRPIAQACFERGFDAVAPLLPAHGLLDPVQARQALALIRAEDWLEAVRQEVRRSLEQYRSVFIFGHSMGGALALGISGEMSPAACAVTAPALIVPPHVRWLSPWIGWANVVVAKKIGEFGAYNPQYRFYQVRAVRQLHRLANRVRRRLHQVRCPVLVAHSIHDPLVKPIVVQQIKKRVPGPVEERWFNRSGHILPLDVEGPAVAQAVADFFGRHRSENHPGHG
jgi:carboxylesterase